MPLGPLVAPAEATAAVTLRPASACPPRALEAMLRRVLPPHPPRRLVAILARCLGELRYAAVEEEEEEEEEEEGQGAAVTAEPQGNGAAAAFGARRSQAAARAAWEADLVLEACELAAQTLDAARRRLAARAVLAWVGGGSEGEGEGEGEAAQECEEEQLLADLMRLCELRGWLVARREVGHG
jgi:hypothetical protein